MRLKYEPSSEPLRISAKHLFFKLRTVQLGTALSLRMLRVSRRGAQAMYKRGAAVTEPHPPLAAAVVRGCEHGHGQPGLACLQLPPGLLARPRGVTYPRVDARQSQKSIPRIYRGINVKRQFQPPLT